MPDRIAESVNHRPRRHRPVRPLPVARRASVRPTAETGRNGRNVDAVGAMVGRLMSCWAHLRAPRRPKCRHKWGTCAVVRLVCGCAVAAGKFLRRLSPRMVREVDFAQ